MSAAAGILPPVLASRRNAEAVGVFALADSAGHRAYLRAGLRQVGAQTEYALPVIGGSRR